MIKASSAWLPLILQATDFNIVSVLNEKKLALTTTPRRLYDAILETFPKSQYPREHWGENSAKNPTQSSLLVFAVRGDSLCIPEIT